jgi:hypothetical protein
LITVREYLLAKAHISCAPRVPGAGLMTKIRKYNNPEDLDELCRSFLASNDTDKGAALEYCRRFLNVLSENPPASGAVGSSRSKPR